MSPPVNLQARLFFLWVTVTILKQVTLQKMNLKMPSEMQLSPTNRYMKIEITTVILWFINKLVSPTFEGGVAGIDVFEMVTILHSRPGWLKWIQPKWTYFSELNPPPRPEHFYFCTLGDIVVWPPLLKKRRGNFCPQNSLS